MSVLSVTVWLRAKKMFLSWDLVWSALIMMIIYSPFICSPLHAPIRRDIAMGFSSQQLAGLVLGEWPWSGCPACCPCLSAFEKTWVICEDPACLAWPSNLLLLCDSSWCFPSSCCFLCFHWLPSWVSWLLLSSLELLRTRDFSTLNLLDELVKKLLLKSVVAWSLQICCVFCPPSSFLLLPETPCSLPGFPVLPTPVFLVPRCPWAVQFRNVAPFLEWCFLAEISHSSSPGSSLGLPG